MDFISGRFFEFEIPKEKSYLLKYFKTEMQRMFLKYYMVFGNCRNFVDHTGYYCSNGVLYKLEQRYQKLIKIYEEAKWSFTEEGMELIQTIESGKFNLTKLPKS